MQDILSLTVNLVKFNSAYLDPDVVSNLVHTLSIHACTTTRYMIMIITYSCNHVACEEDLEDF